MGAKDWDWEDGGLSMFCVNRAGDTMVSVTGGLPTRLRGGESGSSTASFGDSDAFLMFLLLILTPLVYIKLGSMLHFTTLVEERV